MPMNQIMPADPEVARLVEHLVAHGGEVHWPPSGGYFTIRGPDGLVAACVRPHHVTLALAPDDAERALARAGADLERKADTTWYVSYTAANLARPDVYPAALVTALRALHRALPGEGQGEGDLGVEDLIDAVFRDAEYTFGPDDMHQYWHLRRITLQELLGVAAEPDPDSTDQLAFIGLVEACVSILSRDISPFAGFLEAPPGIIDLYSRHGERFDALREDREHYIHMLLSDGIARLFPRARSNRVPWREMRARGVATTPPRDAIDLLLDADL